MEHSFYRTYFDLEKENWWFRVRRNLIFGLFKKYKIDNEKKILDYGCGSGFLVGQLQDRGFDVYGVDMSEDAINFGSSRGVNNLFRANGTRIKFPDEHFDVILAMDVIEHIEDDSLAVSELSRLLKPGGHLIITVPAYQWMWGVQDEVAHHFRRYTMGSFLKLVKSTSGLKVIRRTYFNTFLFLPAALVRIASKAFKLKSRESDFDINNNFLNKLLYTIFNLEVKLSSYISYPFGVSILIILSKN